MRVLQIDSVFTVMSIWSPHCRTEARSTGCPRKGQRTSEIGWKMAQVTSMLYSIGDKISNYLGNGPVWRNCGVKISNLGVT